MPIVNATVPPQLAAAIQAAVDDGTYASESDVVREALKLWSETRRGAPRFGEEKMREASSRREWLESERVCVADLFSAHLHRLPTAAC
ncbi:type II toxin-antitoxin system ParD family antitoxin [Rhizobium sp. LjRoot30]|uniref:ribbon-helix-helix domain-containing protein n=1 Tax=Rhizobium sp. LjRoot30 TaxID=3342320 RepID=UPI003ED0FDEF